MEDLSSIKSVDFGIYSPSEIEKISVCQIYLSKLTGPNTVYDERMGVLNNSKVCPQCEENYTKCVGHFGHIKLNYEIIHPLFYRIALSFLKCFCYKCSRFILCQDQFVMNSMNEDNNEKLFKVIVEKCEKNETCVHCLSQQPKFSLSPDNIIYISDGKTSKMPINDKEVKRVFENIVSEDVDFIKIDSSLTHPRSLIITNLLVIPPIARPYIIADNITCDDDLTIQYVEIIKCNNQLDKNNKITETKKQKFIQTLKFRIKCLFDNSQEKIKHTNGRPLKGIKKRLTGKEGQIRNNLMGKRVNRSARTVIGPDPTLKLTEIAVPQKMADILTYPVVVNKYNKEEIRKMLLENKVNFLIKKENEKSTKINLKYALYNKLNLLKSNEEKMEVVKKFEINVGDVIERKLKEGDIVLLNRQPTLHKGSMLAQTIKIIGKDCKTIRMNLAITKTFNADFDGDEMNIHVPSNLESETELRLLSSTDNNLISAQGSKPNIVIVQDALLGAYLMTSSDKKISKGNFYQLTMKSTLHDIVDRVEYVHKKYKQLGKEELCFTGKAAFSLLLPKTFCITSKDIVVKDGVLIEGFINKKQLGGSPQSFILLLNKEYSRDTAVDFINNIQFISNEWLMQNSFSIGIKDCRVTKSSEINKVIKKCFLEANICK